MSMYTLDNPDTTQRQLIEQIRRYVQVRWIYIFVFAIMSLAATYLVEGFGSSFLRNLTTVLAVIVANFGFLFLTKFSPNNRRFHLTSAVAQIVFDILIISFVTFTQGPHISKVILIYTIPILASGIIFTRESAYVTAALASAAYSLILGMWRFNINPLPIEPTVLDLGARYNYLAPVLAATAAFFTIALVTNFLTTKAEQETTSHTVDEILALATHQLRTPAAAVTGYLELILQEDQLSKKQIEYISKSLKENRREIHLVDNFLKLAILIRKDKLDAQEIDVALMVAEIINSYNRSRPDTKIELGVDQKDIIIYAEYGLIWTLVDNLLDNAVNSSREIKPVTVEVRPGNKHVHIVVIDQGTGMDTNKLDEVFEKFHLPKPGEEISGAGLGLYLVKQIVEAHKGKIQIESTPGKGTTVTIQLPLEFKGES